MNPRQNRPSERLRGLTSRSSGGLPIGRFGRARTILALGALLLLSLACSISGDSASSQGSESIDTNGTNSTDVPATEAPSTSGSSLDESACELVPEAAIERFLYDFDLDQRVSELDPDGVYCRFESVVVEGQGADLGRGLAATTVKLWDTTAACQDAAGAVGSEMTATAPWSFLSVTTIPDKPDLILSVTAIQGDRCVTVSAADISSQPLDHWLDFLDAIVTSLG